MELHNATITTLSLPCRDDAAAVITKLLRRSRLGTVRDTLALLAAHALRDEGIVDSVSALAKDSAQSIAQRTIYLNLLAVYTDCRREVNNWPGFEDRWTVLRWMPHQCGRAHRQPLSNDARERARAGIAWMGAHDPDTRLRELSRRVAEELAHREQ